ncbi:Na+/H+ antiporter subunit E [Mycoplasmatota bacterium]|nr:Na+/H+ antiporter subunit E [Mycoplasmatota bacterium]
MKKTYGATLVLILLLLFWFILSFEVNFYIAIIGLLVSLMVVFFNYDLIFNKNEITKLTIRTIMRFFVLIFILLYNIVVSNIEVAKIVLSKKMPIDPGFVTIKNKLNKEFNQALYANSITLTPGTLTVDMNHGEIVVHGLLRQHVKDLEGSRLEKAFLDLEKVKKND